jgi:hypothetical protein
MRSVWWVGVCIALSGCGEKQNEASAGQCTSSNDCSAGSVCTAGRCAPAPDGSGGTSNDPDTGAGNAGSGGGGASPADASGEVDSAPPDGSGADAGACFTAPPVECGAPMQWPPIGAKDATGRWTLLRALPIDGADGFAIVLADGDPATGDHYLAKLNAKTGCTELVSPAFPARLSLQGIQRAIFRGGTFAVLAQCLQRFTCGKTLFVNGTAWPDPTGTPDLRLVDVDVAADGKIFVASSESVQTDAGTTENLLERWLSPTLQVLAERRNLSPGAVVKVAVLANDSIAIAAHTDGTQFIQFQSSELATTFTWAPAPGSKIQGLGARASQLGVAGILTPSGLWFGVLNGEEGTSVWTRPKADLARDDPGPGFATLGVEVNANGSVNAAVWTNTGTYLVLDASKDNIPAPTPKVDASVPPSFGRALNPAIRTQSDGTVLWATELWGTYCKP